METNPNTIRLLEMLDNPDAYSEQEVRDIINKDDETRESYRLMVAAKQGYRNREEETIDIDNAWKRLEASPQPSPIGREPSHRWLKVAASVIGILFVCVIAYAACVKFGVIGWQKQDRQLESTATNNKENIQLQTTTKITPASELKSDTTKSEPVIYDNIPLEKMLPKIATYYGYEVTFKNYEARQLRFHFVWNREEGIEKVVDNLNHFESLSVTLKDKQLIVE